jgi:hypothetical protein
MGAGVAHFARVATLARTVLAAYSARVFMGKRRGLGGHISVHRGARDARRGAPRQARRQAPRVRPDQAAAGRKRPQTLNSGRGPESGRSGGHRRISFTVSATSPLRRSAPPRERGNDTASGVVTKTQDGVVQGEAASHVPTLHDRRKRHLADALRPVHRLDVRRVRAPDRSELEHRRCRNEAEARVPPPGGAKALAQRRSLAGPNRPSTVMPPSGFGDRSTVRLSG